MKKLTFAAILTACLTMLTACPPNGGQIADPAAATLEAPTTD